MGHDPGHSPGRPVVRGAVRPAAGRLAGHLSETLAGRRRRRSFRPTVPFRRRLRVRVVRPVRGPPVSGRHARRFRRVRALREPVQNRDQRGRRRYGRQVFGISVERDHGRGDQRPERVSEPTAVALLSHGPGRWPVRSDAVRQNDRTQSAPRARSPGQRVVQHGRHGGPEPGIRRGVQGVRRGVRHQTVLLPREPGVPGPDRARRRPSHVRQVVRTRPTLGRRPDAVQVDRVRGVRPDVEQTPARGCAHRLDGGPAPRASNCCWS